MPANSEKQTMSRSYCEHCVLGWDEERLRACWVCEFGVWDGSPCRSGFCGYYRRAPIHGKEVGGKQGAVFPPKTTAEPVSGTFRQTETVMPKPWIPELEGGRP